MRKGVSWEMKVASLTNIGGRKINQDYYLCDKKNGVYITADGIGGYLNGEVASAYASEKLHKKLKNLRFEDFNHNIRQIIYQVNGELVEFSNKSFGGVMMGTTILGVKVFEQGAAYVSVGDTNLYGLTKDTVVQINTPHVFPDDELRRVISSALGPDCLEKIDSGHIREDFDYLLLCTDGLNKFVTVREVLDIVNESDFVDVPHQLVDTALKAGSNDNITLVLLDMRG